jgi:ribose transport system substrate-binding protein
MMARNHKNDPEDIDRRLALKSLTGIAILWPASAGVRKLLNLGGWVEGASAAVPTPTIPVIVKNITSVYWQTVHAGARKAGQDLGVNVSELGPLSESDNAGQIGILESALASKPPAIVIAPVEFAALGKAIDNAAKSVKIIGMESTAESKAFTSFVTIDNAEAGRMAADALANAIKRSYADTEGDVALITSPPGNASLDERVKAFRGQIAAKYGALTIVSEKAGDAMKATGYKIMVDLINEYPELRGVFAADASIAQGAAQAVAENMTNKTGDKINLVGFGIDDTLAKFLLDGTLAALIVQNPFRMGYDSVKAAFAASRGEPVPLMLTVGAKLITKPSLSSARGQDLNPSNK